MSNVQLTECTPKTTTKITARFTGAPVVQGSCVIAAIVPYDAVLMYEHRTSKDLDGWVSHSWFCTSVDVTGYRVLKPGPNGEVRVSDKVTHDARWSVWTSAEDLTVTERGDLPEFLVHLIEELRPSGEVRTIHF